MISSRNGAGRPPGLPILTYHSLGSECAVTRTSLARFSATLHAFHEAGYRSVALDDWIARGCPAEAGRFAVAFDDGLCSILDGLDVMSRLDIKATIFVVTDWVGRDNAWPGQWREVPVERTLDWDELRALADAGFTIASHGVSHAALDRLSPSACDSELRAARDMIESQLGQTCTLLAYPYGRESSTVRRVAAQHHVAAFGTRLDLARLDRDRLDLPRIDAYYLRSDEVVASLVAGRAEGWLRWRRTLRSLRQGILGRGERRAA